MRSNKSINKTGVNPVSFIDYTQSSERTKKGSIDKNFLSQNVQNILDASHEHISNAEKHIPNGGISGQIIGMTDSGVEWVDLEENLTAENLGALPITGGKLESNNFPILKIKRTQSGQSSTINFESGDGELIMLEAVAANNEEHTPELWIRDRSDNTRLLHLSKQHKKIYDPKSNSLKEILVKDADLLDEIGALPLTGGTLKSNRGELDPVITMEGSENFAIMDLQSASGGIRVQQGSDSTHGNYFAVYDKSDNEKNILKISSSTHEICGKKILLQGDTVNNLLATEPGNPLDAVQGKALADMIGEINGNLGKIRIEKIATLNGGTTSDTASTIKSIKNAALLLFTYRYLGRYTIANSVCIPKRTFTGEVRVYNYEYDLTDSGKAAKVTYVSDTKVTYNITDANWKIDIDAVFFN